MSTTYQVGRGRAYPLGATPDAKGVNFSIFSENATSIELLIFDDHDSVEPIQIVNFNPRINKTFHFWHCHVAGLETGMHYAYRVDGPNDLSGRGFRFNRNKVLLDPYAKGITDTLWKRGDACHPHDNLATSLRGVIIDTRGYDWEGDQPLGLTMAESIVYEMHVGGFTKSPSSGVKNPGTFQGIIEKIPYLKELGITAVELLPVFEFDESELDKMTPDGVHLSNYWGYSTVGFFAPNNNFCVSPEFGSHLDEFRDMVKALHRAGIEVILDVVFNHTSEGNHEGPTISFKGVENSSYYHLVEPDRQYYMDYSGCGNTVNCNHPLVDKFILECLEYWTREMHVDGFRFDEGSILSRGEDGAPMVHPPVIWHIELSDALSDSKMFAEAWDAAGLYQVGYFPGYRWAEWNGKYRDDMRKFVKGDANQIGAFANRLGGSSDLYQATGHLPINSVNFVNCHDGFTLNDLVSYNGKHNDANGEGNRDGVDDNMSWNCGVEGPTDDAEIEALRNQQVKNFATVLFLSQGVPLFVAGDEIRRTQGGNNNTYCHDNELNWFDWSLVEKNGEIYRFFKHMIAFRRKHPVLHRSRFFSGERNDRDLLDVSWHGLEVGKPSWDDPEARVIACTLGGFDDDADIHIMTNMGSNDETFELPGVMGRRWYKVVDTGEMSPGDFLDRDSSRPIASTECAVRAHSIVVLISA